MKAIILAGGKGSRMKNKTNLIPKPMLTIGGKPILHHQIELLKRYNITDVTIIVNHLKDVIIDYFEDGKNFGVKINYYQEKTPLGTVGGIKEIENSLTSDFIVFYGDVMINMNLEKLINFHLQHKSECSIVLHPNDHPFDSDLVEMNNDCRISAFNPKPHNPEKYYKNLVNAGAYIFNPKIFTYIKKGIKADFGKDIFPEIYKKIKMYGYNTSEYLKDMGTPERLLEVTNAFETGKIEKSNFDNKQKAIFLDRDGVINKEISFIHKAEDFILYDYTTKAIKSINKSTYLSIVITNQSVIARNLCTINELEYIHKKLETELGNNGAKLDQIYYCPHHPDKGFPEENTKYKIDCECRKPKSGMLITAAKDFNIDLKKSFMIGDSERDIICGHNVGTTTIGLRTGHGVKKAKILPDYFFNDLHEATEFIINEPLKPLFTKIYNQYLKQKNDKLYIINIGGNTRSGKSTLSTYLKKSFESKGHKILRLNLDNWIVPKKDRINHKNVYERFNLNKIDKDINNLLLKNEITIQTYQYHPEQESQKITYQLTNHDIVIIDGIVALSSEILRNHSDLKIFMQINNKLLKERFQDIYKWKEYNDADIKSLFNSRMADEYSLIAKDEKHADIVNNL